MFGHPFNVVKKKAFSMGVSKILDFVPLVVFNVVRQGVVGVQELATNVGPLYPQLMPRLHGVCPHTSRPGNRLRNRNASSRCLAEQY